MHSAVEDLIKLQKMALAKEEHKTTQTHGQAAHLTDPMQALTARLPQEIRFLYRKMTERGKSVISPIVDGVCSACGMKLPVSLIQAVRAERTLCQCESCARVLYYPDKPPRRVREGARRGEPRQIGIARFSGPALMIPALSASTKQDAIRELAEKMSEAGLVEDGAHLGEEGLERETLASTAVESGLAFPHVRHVEGGGVAFSLGLSRKGIRFGAPARRLTRIVFFSVIPTAANTVYLRLLSGLTRAFAQAPAREKLLEATTAAKMWSVLVKATKTTVR